MLGNYTGDEGGRRGCGVQGIGADCWHDLCHLDAPPCIVLTVVTGHGQAATNRVCVCCLPQDRAPLLKLYKNLLVVYVKLV